MFDADRCSRNGFGMAFGVVVGGILVVIPFCYTTLWI